PLLQGVTGAYFSHAFRCVTRADMLRPPVTTADICHPDTPAPRIRRQFTSAPNCPSQASGPADRPFSAFAGNSPGGHQPRRGLTGPHPPSVVASFSTLGGDRW